MVAFGTVFSGLWIFSKGILADSNPRKAYNVNAATKENDVKLLSPVILNSGKLSRLKKKIPKMITKTNGSNFKTVVITWILPVVLIPFELIQVKNQIIDKPIETANTELVCKIGKKKLRPPIIAIAIAALLIQVDIQ